MADGRKNNGGHSTKGFAGRKSKAEEVKVAEKLRNILSDNDVAIKLADKVQDGDLKAIELWLAYIWGRPTQSVDHSTLGDKLQQLPEIIVKLNNDKK